MGPGLWLAVACFRGAIPGAEGEPGGIDASDGASAARVREPHLQLTAIHVGGTIVGRIAFGAPGAQARLWLGHPGPDGLRGAREIGGTTLDADGTARVEVPTPASVADGATLGLQVEVDGVRSNVVERTVGAGSGPLGSNVLVVLLDDVGTDKLALYGSTNPAFTPTIDALAASGVTFDTVYTRPVCQPARAALITGRHGRRTGLGTNWHTNDPWELGLEQITLAELVSLSPYASWTSSYVGKWHLGSDVAASGFDHPTRQGFGFYAGSFENLFAESTGYESYYDWLKVVDGVEVETTTYATTDTIDDAIARVGAMPEPWLLVVSPNAAHTPMDTPPAALVPTPATPGDGVQVRAVLQAADTELARLFAAIPPEVYARTTVFLTADNGTHRAYVQEPATFDRAKGTLMDGGIRVPLIVAGAGVTAVGARSPALVDLVDLFPTIAELAGVELAGLSSVLDPAAPYALDGRSLVPQLSEPAAPNGRRYLYSELFGPPGPGPYTDVDRQVIRDDRFKLWVDNQTGRHMLFEYLPGAPDEGDDLVGCGLDAERQAAHDRLEAALAAATAELRFDADPMPIRELDTGHV
ncbi:MAG: sulfatase-like hydrolase/transferase, partial [Myxococcota bacterium]